MIEQGKCPEITILAVETREAKAEMLLCAELLSEGGDSSSKRNWREGNWIGRC